MAYFVCDKCDKKHYIFGETKAEDVAKSFGITSWAELPLDPQNARLVDDGRVEDIKCDELKAIADTVQAL